MNLRRSSLLLLAGVVFAACSITGQKYHDQNGNGQKDSGEPGLQGWTIYAEEDDTETDNGQLDVGEPSATTDANGNYVIYLPHPGTWEVREVPKDEYEQTAPEDNEYGGLEAPPNHTGKDFGNFEKVSIAGQVFNDANSNGTKEGEPPLEGWTIKLTKPDDSSFEQTATSDASGNYLFNGLGPGTYRVREVVASGYTQTTANPADVAAVGGTDVTGVDFGNYKEPQQQAVAAVTASPSPSPSPSPTQTLRFRAVGAKQSTENVAGEELAKTGNGWMLPVGFVLLGVAVLLMLSLRRQSET
jgi:hypothetical protein